MRRIALFRMVVVLVVSGLSGGVAFGQFGQWARRDPVAISNPAIANAADPFITRDGGRYLLLATHENTITIWYGRELAQVPAHPRIVWQPSDGMKQVWSPTLWKMGKRWWIYFTAAYPRPGGGFEKHAIYVLESKSSDPLGEYEFKGSLKLGHEAIDPSILHQGGVDYLMYVDVDPQKWNAVWITRLKGPMEPNGDGKELIHPEETWERGEPTSHNYPVAEGPTAVYHGGTTFVVYSGSDTGTYVYCLGLLTYSGNGDVMDKKNWIKMGPVFSFSDAHGVYGPGRGSFVSSPDGKDWWLVYHAKAVKQYTYAGRSVRIQPFTWDASGVPQFGVPVAEGPLETGNRK